MADAEQQEEQQEESQGVSPAENKARKNGWLPEDGWHGDAADWVDFKEFNLRGELMGRINEQSSIINHLTNKVDDRDTALKDMSELQSKISEQSYKKALNDLLSQKKEALAEDNYDQVVDIDEEISDLKDAKPKPVEAEEASTVDDKPPQEIIDWLAKPEQSWYHTDKTLRLLAEGFAVEFQQDNPNIPPLELIDKVNIRIRKEMPHKFNTSGDVDTGGEYSSNTTRKRGNGAASFSDLNEEQKAACLRFERLGTLTKEEYIKSLVDIGEL